MHVGTRLAAWRKHKKWTQVRLARRLGLTRGAIAQWEAGGSSRPRTAHLEAAVRALGLSMERFYGEVPTAPRKERAA